MNYVQQLKEKIKVKDCAIETMREHVHELAKAVENRTINQDELKKRIQYIDSECVRIEKISKNI